MLWWFQLASAKLSRLKSAQYLSLSFETIVDKPCDNR
jgi:hypothetical protein